jgi:hypothetical protein
LESPDLNEAGLTPWRALCTDARIHKEVESAVGCANELADRYVVTTLQLSRTRRIDNTIVLASSIALPSIAAFNGSNAIQKGIAIVAGGTSAFDDANRYEVRVGALDAAVNALRCGTDLVLSARQVSQEAREENANRPVEAKTSTEFLVLNEAQLNHRLAEELMALVAHIEFKTRASMRDGHIDQAAIRASIQAAIKAAVEKEKANGANGLRARQSEPADDLDSILAQLTACSAGL